MLMMGSHSIVSSALARTTGAAAALAAFSVAQTIAMMFESPCFALRRLFVSLIDDQHSFATLLKITAVTIAVVFSVQVAIAFSPLGYVLFVRLVGISPELFPQTIGAYKVFMLLPVMSAIRSTFQGLIIVRRKTHYLTLNILIRLATMVGMAAFLTNTEVISGGAVGAVVLVSGMAIEGLMAILTGARLRKDLPQRTHDGVPLTISAAWIFFYPLIAAQFVQSFDRLLISAGLARTVNAEVAIAAYQVAWSLSWILSSVSFNIHQVVLVFVRDEESLRKVQRFALIIGVGATLIMLTISLTPIGYWILTSIIGASAEIAGPTLGMLAVLGLVPFVLSRSEVYAGLLMRRKQTISITVAKILNLTALGLSVLVISKLYPQAGGLLAAVSMLVGYSVEWVTLYLFSRGVAVSRTSLTAMEATD
jgi:hypothetical protein